MAQELHLWRTVRITDQESCNSVRTRIQAEPVLAQAITELELRVGGHDKAKERQDDGIYSDLALAASLPNLKSLAVRTACREYDHDRSQKAFRDLLKLNRLESCDLYWEHENGENWALHDLTACFSLIHHPSVQQVCLRGFDSRAGVRSDMTDQKRRGTPLQKLSLLNCDLHPRDLAELLDACAPLELEFLFWHSGHYPPISTGMADPDEYVQAIHNACLERLTFYQDHERDEDVPLRFEQLKSLKYLSTNIFTLIGGDSSPDAGGDEPADHDSPVNISLPPELEVLDILFFEDLQYVDWGSEVSHFLERLKAQQEGSSSKLRKLRFRTSSKDTLDSTKMQELNDFGAQCGIEITVGHLPEDWEDGPKWVKIHGFRE